MTQQLPIFPFATEAVFPTTRYQGSKRQMTEWIWENVREFTFDSVLDVFGGTAVVSHLFKRKGKSVTYNDYLAFNHTIGLALIENKDTFLTQDDLKLILSTSDDYPDFIQTTFQGIFFTDEENRWLDRMVTNINRCFTDKYKKALAFTALFQACIIKRPYNLFHRANLYMRQANVQRSFGNKTTWDTPFESHFRQFVSEINAAVFDNQRENSALNLDALEAPVGADLVYIDPPYFNARGVGVDYREFYHFLEGLIRYETWGGNIDYTSKHRRLIPEPNLWSRPEHILSAVERLISRHQASILVLSYRDDGIPSQEQLLHLLKKYKPTVKIAHLPKQYALSKRRSHEILLVAS